MKLYEILQQPKIQYKKPKQEDLWDVHHRIAHSKLLTKLGQGLYASVRQHKNRPGVVTKISDPVENLENDGYFNYLKMLATNKSVVDNLYFPKIYSIKVYETPPSEMYSYSMFYIVEMERLESFKDASLHELEMLADRMFYDFDDFVKMAAATQLKSNTGLDWDPQNIGPELRRMSYVMKQRQKIPPHPAEKRSNQELKISEQDKHNLYVGIIAEFLDNAVKGHKSDLLAQIKDPMLKQALMLIKKLLSQGGHGRDIHYGNIMVRRTSVGPQLVITDPLS